MELRVIKYFLALANEGNISKAALALHITQPTLSRQLHELEIELGEDLFIRGNRTISLTEKGNHYKKRCEEILALVDKTVEELAMCDDQVCGCIYIGGGETDAMRYIANAIKQVQLLYPNITFEIYSGNADDVCDKLDNGLLDFGLLIEPADIQKYDYIKLPVQDTWGVLMRKDSPLATLSKIKAIDLVNLPLICSRQNLVENEITSWFGKLSPSLNIVANFNLVYNASLLVEAGVGYALSLDKLVHTSDSHALCFRELSPRLNASLDIVWKKYTNFTKPQQIFFEILQREIANH